jgi:uncharacterized membrane protein (UPF0127 family)
VPNNAHAVCVYNKTREAFVGIDVEVADTYVRRLLGLLGKTRRWCRPGKGIWIVPSRGIHTIGMLFPIDIIFLSKEKRVLGIEEYVRPFHISKVYLHADSVLELPPYTIFQAGVQVGDLLEIVPRNGSQSRLTRAVPISDQ